MSDDQGSGRRVSLPGVLGGDDSLPDGYDPVDAYVAKLEDESGMPELLASMYRSRPVPGEDSTNG